MAELQRSRRTFGFIGSRQQSRSIRPCAFVSLLSLYRRTLVRVASVRGEGDALVLDHRRSAARPGRGLDVVDDECPEQRI
jgi:hypothetical protein